MNKGMQQINLKALLGLFSCLVFGQIHAVQLSTNGSGEVLVYPYYTVNNDLNTLYSVVNTTVETKALAVRFLEGDNGKEVLTFHVYLSAFDVWTGVLIPTTSTLPNHIGEDSVIHITTDTSCAPFLVKSGQEFLPFAIDADLDADNQSMQRATEGHLEIIEMGQFTAQGIAWADHGAVGVPSNCAAFMAQWADNDQWDLNDLDPASGGLIGSASLVNVGEGIAYNYDAVALQNFWDPTPDNVEFPAPGLPIPNLNSSFPQSTVVADDGEVYTSEWEHGHQAVSAVLMKSQIINEYSFEDIVAGKSEWVMSQPTKSYHTSDSNHLLAPYTQPWDGSQACDAFEMSIWDRESIQDIDFGCGILCPPGDLRPKLCQSTNVIEFIRPGADPSTYQQILGSGNNTAVFGPHAGVVQGGWASMEFDPSNFMSLASGAQISGLPVTGFMLQQFTNANALPGLLAQYGGLFNHKSRTTIE